MKNTTIYTLLCTTMIIPCISFAMEKGDTTIPEIEEAAKQERQKLRQRHPSTPDVYAAKKKEVQTFPVTPKTKESIAKAKAQPELAKIHAQVDEEVSQFKVKKYAEHAQKEAAKKEEEVKARKKLEEHSELVRKTTREVITDSVQTMMSQEEENQKLRAELEQARIAAAIFQARLEAAEEDKKARENIILGVPNETTEEKKQQKNHPSGNSSGAQGTASTGGLRLNNFGKKEDGQK